ncbi:diguanylate cyclase, partial [Kineococcus sp. T13]|uniref:diguanylate cyclase domain-containing protein n=1 Tax=Kineococcus vitellinus TaxID=2696565 RepID=UPI0014135B1D|nr:diguanylate cyclase [Kineococcus vitellinus]
MSPAGAGPDWRALAARAPATLLLSGSTVLWASDAVGELVGAETAALAGTDALELVLAADRARARTALHEALRRPGSRLGPLRLRPAARPDALVEVEARTRSGVHLVVAGWDVAQRLAAQSALAERAGHDRLTGLPNRSLLADRWQAARRRAHADPRLRTFVLVCDLDGLKEVNDERGHRVGDALLVRAARRLAAEVRPGDTVARLGGDEFVVLVEGVPAEHVEALARRLRSRVGRAAGVPVRMSVGWAADDRTRPAEAVLAEADARMYEDKRARRRASGAPAGRAAGGP